MAWTPASGDRRCVHKSSRTGEQCRLWGVRGTDPPTCKVHGASAPQVRTAAERRVAEATARELARQVDVDAAQFDGDPYAALRDLLSRDQTEVERFGRLADQLGDGQLTYRTRSGVEQLRAALNAYRAERDALGRHLDLLLRAGVAERLIQVREVQHNVNEVGTAAIFGHCLTLFAGDVSSALADARAYEYHDQVMAAFRRRVRQRLENEQEMILPQIRILAEGRAG
jgi:hypothetical protein